MELMLQLKLLVTMGSLVPDVDGISSLDVWTLVSPIDIKNYEYHFLEVLLVQCKMVDFLVGLLAALVA